MKPCKDGQSTSTTLYSVISGRSTTGTGDYSVIPGRTPGTDVHKQEGY